MNEILQGDVLAMLETLSPESINCIVTSPPYFFLRNYQLPPTKWPEMTYAPMPGLPEITLPAMACCLGLEDSIEAYVGHMVLAWRRLWRVLRGDGVAFLNLGDSYANSGQHETAETMNLTRSDKLTGGKLPATGRAPTSSGLKSKNLCGIPWRVAFALQADGWYLRSDVIWAKLNPMPESVTDRPTKAHEYLFMLAKSERYWFDQDAIREPISQTTMERWNGNPCSKTQNDDYNSQGLTPNKHKGEHKLGVSAQGRNKRTVWPIPTEQDPLLSYLLMQLAADNPDKLQVYLDQYTDDTSLKSDVWHLATKPYKEAHFAVMPESLVEPCLLAGCPAQVCAKCEEPWVRVVEKIKGDSETENRPKAIGQAGYGSSTSTLSLSGNGSTEWAKRGAKVKTLHFSPTCQCSAPTRPGVVLDPFFGSGTTGVVAKKLKRGWRGIEKNPEYVELAQKRIDQIQPPLFPPDLHNIPLPENDIVAEAAQRWLFNWLEDELTPEPETD